MKTKLLFLFLIIFQLSNAQQRTCGMETYMETLKSNPELKKQYDDLQNQFELELERLNALNVSNRNSNQTLNPNATINIPVAVHYPSGASLSASIKTCLRSLAQKQVDILNADYNATNTDISLWSNASSFYPGVNIGNMDVQFIIATQNHPSGTGLVNGDLAITFGTDFLSNADYDSTWAGYCNLVVRNISGGILGYSPLGGSPSQGMTVVIDNNAFGATMTGLPSSCTGYVPGAPYNKGRTLTHELGHFFNLDHTFNSCDGSNCNTSGDKVCDTPPANSPYYDCGAPGVVSTSCGTIPQLTMNFMDYVEDACMYMFTAGQATRMTAWYNTITSQLATNVLANNEFISNNFSIIPNPNSGIFSIQLKDQVDNYTVFIYDSLGREVYHSDFNQTTDLAQSIKINNALKGMYFVSIKSNNAIITKKIIIE